MPPPDRAARRQPVDLNQARKISTYSIASIVHLRPLRPALKPDKTAPPCMVRGGGHLGFLVWFGLVGFSFNASLEPQPRARRRARLALNQARPQEDAGHREAGERETCHVYERLHTLNLIHTTFHTKPMNPPVPFEYFFDTFFSCQNGHVLSPYK